MNFEIGLDTVKYKPEADPKKITGTRLASILGKNPYASPFQTWCEITRLYEKPFIGNMFTEAGKTVEKAQIKYIKGLYGNDVVSPTDVYGDNYFEKTFGDFYPEEVLFGGMWDIQKQTNGLTDIIFECKTTSAKHRDDWKDGIPEYYALQAALYAWLSRTDKVVMVASFLDYKDYKRPDMYVPNKDNTIIRGFRVSERYPHFLTEQASEAALWYGEHVGEGISPKYDLDRDYEYLAALYQMQEEEDERRIDTTTEILPAEP
ncbi:MAG: YqaJ viral recombinase family protein [Paludibacteraceae bacterium]|nr:YqaJ viral recombinase family protein [Paludibacteraceae bacterium]